MDISITFAKIEMKKRIFLYILMAAVLTTGCTGSDGPEDAAARTLGGGFDQAMADADSLYARMQFRDAYDIYLQLLDSKEAEDDSQKRLHVLNDLSATSELSGHKVEQNKWLDQLLNLAVQTGNDYYHSLALTAMGQNLFYEGNREKGIDNVIEAVRLMGKTDRADADHLMHGHLIMLARLYGEMKDYDRALQINERNLRLTMEGTRWGLARNQQLIDRRMALAKMAGLLARMGRLASGTRQSRYFQRADSAYTAWQTIHYEGNHTRDYFIVDYMKRRGRYEEAIPIYNSLIDRVRQQGDTLGEMMNTAKWGLAEVYRRIGHFRQAAELYEQVLEIQDTLKSRKARNSAQQLAAIFHDKEQDETIMRQQAENTRQRYLLFTVFAILAAITALAVVVSRKNRVISRKNQSLVAQINEAMTYKEKYIRQQAARFSSAAEPASLDTLTDEQLFQYINDVIVHECLFRRPDFDRQMVMERFSLSKERIGAAFSHGSQYANLSDYTQELRLEYSTLLMSTHPDMSVTQIALESGFSSHAYFGRCFRQRFGMTPTEFRQSASQEQK